MLPYWTVQIQMHPSSEEGCFKVIGTIFGARFLNTDVRVLTNVILVPKRGLTANEGNA